MEFELASRLVGLLYGNILQRNADKGGFEHYLLALQDGRLALKEAIFAFYTSDEFADKFVVNQTPNELAKNMLFSFYGADGYTRREVRDVAFTIARKGYPEALRALLEDDRFEQVFGQVNVPRYREDAPAAADDRLHR